HHRVAPSGGDDLCAVKRLSHGVPASSTPHRPVPGYPSPASFILAYGDFRDWENEFSYTIKLAPVPSGRVPTVVDLKSSVIGRTSGLLSWNAMRISGSGSPGCSITKVVWNCT